MVDSYEDTSTKIVLETLKGYGFTSRYMRNFRLTLIMSRNQSSSTKEKIRLFQAQHKQIMDSIKT